MLLVFLLYPIRVYLSVLTKHTKPQVKKIFVKEKVIIIYLEAVHLLVNSSSVFKFKRHVSVAVKAKNNYSG